MNLTVDLWLERAAIMEFGGGLTRFEAETRAAECYGTTRHQMIKELRDADGCGLAGGYGDPARALDGKRNAGSMPGVQSVAQEKDGSMPQREQEAGRDRGALLALRMGGGEAVR